MAIETKQKNWFKRHWIVTIILLVVLLIIINTIIFGSTSQNPPKSGIVLSDNQKESAQKQYVKENIYELMPLFVHNLGYDLTTLQRKEAELNRKENFNENYKDKWIKSSGDITEVNMINSNSIVVKIVDPSSLYADSGATIYFSSADREELSKVNLYETITFEGRIDSYDSDSGIVIKDAKLSESI